MSRLFLLRHAKAAWANPGTRDFDRPLTAAGVVEATAVGGIMRSSGYLPARIVCSPARRAVETWQAVAEVLGRKPSEALFTETLYASDAGGYLDVVRNNADAGPLLMVGHNPMIEDLATELSVRGDARSRAMLAKGFPPAGLAVFALSDPYGPDALMEQFLIPAEL